VALEPETSPSPGAALVAARTSRPSHKLTASTLLVLALALAAAALWRPPAPPSAKAMLIVEPRQHPDLCAVLKNFHDRVPPDWDLYVFHGADHAPHARSCTRGFRPRRRVVLRPLPANDLSRDEYSAMFTQEGPIWGHVQAEHILVFQTDTAACGGFPGSIDDFVGLYDYIGCPLDDRIGVQGIWGRDVPYFGSGGLSLRSKSFMLRCIRDTAHDGALAALLAPPHHEDELFSTCVASSPRRPLNATAMARLCTMNLFMAESFGVHQLGKWLHWSHRPQFFEYCPEAQALQSSQLGNHSDGYAHYYSRTQSARQHRFYLRVKALDAQPEAIDPDFLAANAGKYP
jgi:hypothetical protein